MWKTWDAGIDWVTATVKPGEDGTNEFIELGMSLLEEQHGEGHEIKPVRLLQYRGDQCGSVFFGGREDGFMLRVSGANAHRAIDQITERVSCAKFTRIDIQTTARAEGEAENTATAAYQVIKQTGSQKGGQARRRLSLIESARDGSSLSVGTRTSAVFSRIYDKSAEQKHRVEPGLWRWEVEYKSYMAERVAETLLHSDSKYTTAQKLCKAHFEDMGIDMSWLQPGEGLKLPSSKPETTTERRLRWLDRTVAPALQRLALAGVGDEAYSILRMASSERNDS